MKQLFSALTIAIVLFSSLATFTKHHTDHSTHGMTLSEEDLVKLAHKLYADKAWKKFDKFLTKCLIFSGLLTAASFAAPEGTHDLTPQRLYAAQDYLANTITTLQAGDTANTSTITPKPHTKVTVSYLPTSLNVKKSDAQSLTNNRVMSYIKSDANHTIILSKYWCTRFSGGLTALLAAIKLGVKIKRAQNHDDNILSFIFTDFWA